MTATLRGEVLADVQVAGENPQVSLPASRLSAKTSRFPDDLNVPGGNLEVFVADSEGFLPDSKVFASDSEVFVAEFKKVEDYVSELLARVRCNSSPAS